MQDTPIDPVKIFYGVEIKAIIGLGNPGKEYERTRHNLGSRVVDRLAKQWEIKLKTCIKINCQIGIRKINKFCILAKPLTYMNSSGIAVNKLLKEYHLQPEEILVISDDFHLPLGTIRIRESGSSGGHKGLESIINCLDTKNFPRLRLGIGPLPENIDPVKFVLQPFTRQEESKLKLFLSQVTDAIETFLSQGLRKTIHLPVEDPNFAKRTRR